MKKITTVVAVLLLIIATVHAQVKKVTINGKVTSFEESLPLEGVVITVKGTTLSTGTQADGTFSLTLLPGQVLIVSLQGYEKKEIVLTALKEYDIVLRLANTFCYKKGNTRLPLTDPASRPVVNSRCSLLVK